MQIALTIFCWHCAMPLARLRQFISIEKTVLLKQNKHKRTWCSRSRSYPQQDYPHCLTRDGAGAHYNAVNAQPEEETTKSIARTQPEGVLVQIPKFLPQNIKDLFQRPQLGSKQQRVGKRRKIAILSFLCRTIFK